MERKSNFVMMIVSSIVCLLPVILALVVYRDLPERMVMQWNFEGNPNWDAPKAVAAFGLPVFFVFLNILIKIVVNRDPKKQNISKVMRVFLDWFIPCVSLTVVPFLLFMGLGLNIPVAFIVLLFVSILFIIIGNYLPKNRQNYSVGIRISWTLNDPDNWNKTHRLAGFIWIGGGIIFIIMSFLALEHPLMLVLLFLILATMIIVPILYSYSLYKRKK